MKCLADIRNFARIIPGLVLVLVTMSACSGLVEATSIQNQIDQELNEVEVDQSSPKLMYPPALTDVEPYPSVIDRLGTPVSVQLPPGQKFPSSPVTIDGAQVVEMDGSPSGYGLRITGTMPTPCHELRVEFSDPDDQDQIQVLVYAISDPGQVCIQVIESFDVTIAIDPYNPALNSLGINQDFILEPVD